MAVLLLCLHTLKHWCASNTLKKKILFEQRLASIDKDAIMETTKRRIFDAEAKRYKNGVWWTQSLVPEMSPLWSALCSAEKWWAMNTKSPHFEDLDKLIKLGFCLTMPGNCELRLHWESWQVTEWQRWAYQVTLTPFSSIRFWAVDQLVRTRGGKPKIGSMHIRRYCFVAGSVSHKNN